MTRTPPASGPPSPPDEANDAGAVLAALAAAAADHGLPADTRALLARAVDTLDAARADADAARARYDTLFDAVPDPVSILDEDGIVLDLNRAGLAAYRRPRDQIVGQPIHVLNPDLPSDHLGPVWETLNRGGTYVVEVSNMRADGSRFPVEVHSAGFRHDGRDCIVAVARDLSGRQDAELRYRELMETIDTGILVRDAQGRITHVNPAALRLFGIPNGQRADLALTRDDWWVVDEDGRELRDEELPAARVLRDGRPVRSMLLGFYHRRRRTLTWFSVTAVAQYGAGSDRVQQVMSLFSDVTALKRDATLFDRVQAMAHVGGWEWDTGRDRLYLTAQSRRIIGRDPAPRAIGDLLDCLLDEHRERLRRALDTTLATGLPVDLEVCGLRDDGAPFWVRAIAEAETAGPLKARLTGTLQDITERRHAEERLQVQARTDPLTGLLNRDAVLAAIDARLAEPDGSRIAVLYIDLDRFKVVNDVLGHAAGDRVLTSAARRLQHAVGQRGVIARFGGDEFLVACPLDEHDDGRAALLAEAILRVFGDDFSLDGEQFAITASIGVARAPEDGTTSQQLIQSADVAMYDSKRRSRNGWQLFTADLAEQQQQRLQLETQLRRAVDKREFHLVYQPQLELATGRLLSVEALIRWDNPALGPMEPSRFIDHAETTGDIVGIGEWVLIEACRQMRRWREQGLALQRVAVNVSYRQFLGEDLAANVAAALAETGLPGSALELEFTERVLIEDEPETLHTFARLRELGVTLTIDDFGEGYSALNYLRRLPIHGLKLSQLFVQGVPDNASDVAVCQAVTGIARSLGLGLVAEGVENEAQRDFLIGLGVEVGQGFLFARGMSPEDVMGTYAAASA